MAKAIDASHFGEIMEQWKKDCLECDDQHGADVIADVILQLDDMPTLTPPNEPLTIEQLREMDGEPVWIVDIGPHKWYGPGWAIVERDNCLVRTAKNWSPVFFERYGEQWLAYRRLPEGEDK